MKALQWGVSKHFSFSSAVRYPIVEYSLNEKEMNGMRMLDVGVKLSSGTQTPVAFMLWINKYGVSADFHKTPLTFTIQMIQRLPYLFDSVALRSSFLSSLKIFSSHSIERFCISEPVYVNTVSGDATPSFGPGSLLKILPMSLKKAPVLWTSP